MAKPREEADGIVPIKNYSGCCCCCCCCCRHFSRAARLFRGGRLEIDPPTWVASTTLYNDTDTEFGYCCCYCYCFEGDYTAVAVDCIDTRGAGSKGLSLLLLRVGHRISGVLLLESWVPFLLVPPDCWTLETRLRVCHHHESFAAFSRTLPGIPTSVPHHGWHGRMLSWSSSYNNCCGPYYLLLLFGSFRWCATPRTTVGRIRRFVAKYY